MKTRHIIPVTKIWSEKQNNYHIRLMTVAVLYLFMLKLIMIKATKVSKLNLSIIHFLKGAMYSYASLSQFHQHFTHVFFVRKCFEQLFSSYILALEFLEPKFWTKTACVKRWWNWRHGAVKKNSSFRSFLFCVLMSWISKSIK